MTAPGRYRLDPKRTTIRFRTRHMFGLGTVRGEFEVRGGHVDGTGSLGDCVVHAVASADSFRAGNPTRDRMVRSPTYLDAPRYPNIDFVAHELHTERNPPVVDGTLTAHGVAAPLRIAIITAGRGLAGRRLTIEIAAIAVRE